MLRAKFLVAPLLALTTALAVPAYAWDDEVAAEAAPDTTVAQAAANTPDLTTLAPSAPTPSLRRPTPPSPRFRSR